MGIGENPPSPTTRWKLLASPSDLYWTPGYAEKEKKRNHLTVPKTKVYSEHDKDKRDTAHKRLVLTHQLAESQWLSKKKLYY